MFGGYLDDEDADALDRIAKAQGLSNRTELLKLLAQQSDPAAEEKASARDVVEALDWLEKHSINKPPVQRLIVSLARALGWH